jgi:hypothetical protein
MTKSSTRSLTPSQIHTKSKWVYAKAALQGVDADILIKTAEELDVEVPRAAASTAPPPRNRMGTTNFRLSISHISLH